MATNKARPKTNKKTKAEIKQKQLRIQRVNPDNIRSVPVNDIVVTHSQNEFFITFSSLEPPPILDEQELDKWTEVDAIARAKIVVPADFVDAIIKTLTKNLDTFKSRAK